MFTKNKAVKIKKVFQNFTANFFKFEKRILFLISLQYLVMLEDGFTEMAAGNFWHSDSPSIIQSSIRGFIYCSEKKHSWLSRNTAEVSAKAYLTKLILQRKLPVRNLIRIRTAAVEVWTIPYLQMTTFPQLFYKNFDKDIYQTLTCYTLCVLVDVNLTRFFNY